MKKIRVEFKDGLVLEGIVPDERVQRTVVVDHPVRQERLPAYHVGVDRKGVHLFKEGTLIIGGE